MIFTTFNFWSDSFLKLDHHTEGTYHLNMFNLQGILTHKEIQVKGILVDLRGGSG